MNAHFSRALFIFAFLSIVAASCLRQPGSYETTAKLAYMPQMRSVSFLGSNQASFVEEIGRDLRVSTDGGQTWQVIPANSVVGGFESATITPNGRAFAVNREGRVFTANPPGSAWTEISDLKETEPRDFTGAEQIEFVDDKTGWILEFLSIWHTQDGGVTWSKKLSVLTPGVNGQPSGMYPLDSMTLVAIGGKGQVYLTRDGGANWKIQTVGTKPDLKDVWFSDNRTGWICGYTSGRDSISMVLFETKDGGESWEELPIDEPNMMPSSVSFVENEGWISGRRYLKIGSAQPVLLHTQDGGAHWANMPVASDDPFFSLVRFIDKRNGWLVGRDNLYRSEDGGNTWRRVLALAPAG